MPKRIQRRRTAGWRMPPGAVYVGRPTRWANPFRVGMQDEANAHFGRLTAQQAVDLFALHTGPMGNYEYDDETLARLRRELGGKDLVCWCPDGDPCHADVLLEIANAPERAVA